MSAENRYDELYIFIPVMKQIIRIAEGTGDNLLPEDIEEGYVDYIYYEQYELSQDFPEIDGGQVLLEEMFRDKFRCTEEAVGDVLSMAYGTLRREIVVEADSLEEAINHVESEYDKENIVLTADDACVEPDIFEVDWYSEKDIEEMEANYDIRNGSGRISEGWRRHIQHRFQRWR